MYFHAYVRLLLDSSGNVPSPPGINSRMYWTDSLLANVNHILPRGFQIVNMNLVYYLYVDMQANTLYFGSMVLQPGGQINQKALMTGTAGKTYYFGRAKFYGQ